MELMFIDEQRLLAWVSVIELSSTRETVPFTEFSQDHANLPTR